MSHTSHTNSPNSPSSQTFQELGLSEPLLRAIASEQYSTPTPIQAKAIPPVMEGRDVLGSAQTGTGKTAAFALPILHRFTAPGATATGAPGAHRARPIRALILAPTRELAGQIQDSFRTYGKNTPLRYAVVFGGVSQHPQTQALKAGVDVLIATPGRLLDLMEQGYVDLRRVEVLVLDEADQMLDMGFIHDIRKVIAMLPARRQNLLFSATMPAEIRDLADSILRNPVRVAVAPVSAAAETVKQSVYFVEKRNKPALLSHYIDQNGVSRMLVFTRTKHGADRVAKHLVKSGVRAQAIHGNKSQNARNRAMADFKSGRPPVLVATDIAARGLDIDEISHVVNYDVPNVPETYVHRIGRTGRAGASGTAVSFCDREERAFLTAIEKLTRRSVPVREDHPAYPAQSSQPQHDDRRQGGGQSGRERGGQGYGRASHGGHGGPGGHGGSDRRGPQASWHASPRPAHRTHPVAVGSGARQASHGPGVVHVQPARPAHAAPHSHQQGHSNHSRGQGKPGKPGKPGTPRSHAPQGGPLRFNGSNRPRRGR